MNTRLKKLLTAMNESEKLEQIGTKIIQETLRRIGEVEQGKKPDKFDVALIFKKGDVVPDSFRGLPNIKIDATGVLLEDWTDGWCQSGWNESGEWGDTWGECWDNSTATVLTGGLHYGVNPQWVKKNLTIKDFSRQEQEILQKYGIIR